MKIAFFPFFASWAVHHAADKDLMASLISMNHEVALLRCTIAYDSKYCIQSRDFEALSLENKNRFCQNCQESFELLFSDVENQANIFNIKYKFESIEEYQCSLDQLTSPYNHIGNHIAKNAYFYIEPSLITHYELSSAKLLDIISLENIEGHILEFLSIVRSILEFFSKVEQDRVILFNCRFYNYSAVYIIANFLGIPLFI